MEKRENNYMTYEDKLMFTYEWAVLTERMKRDGRDYSRIKLVCKDTADNRVSK